MSMKRKICQLCKKILWEMFCNNMKKPRPYLSGRYPADVSGTAVIQPPKLVPRVSGGSYGAYWGGIGSAVDIPLLGSSWYRHETTS